MLIATAIEFGRSVRRWDRFALLVGVICSVALSAACGTSDLSGSHSPISGTVGTNVLDTAQATTASAGAESGAIESTASDSLDAGIETHVPATPDWSSPLGMGIVLSKVHFPSIGELAWASTRIVSGSVVEIRAPIYIADPNRPDDLPGSDPSRIFTDYVIQVDRAYRGQKQNELVIRQQGGTIGNVTVMNMSEPEMNVGQQGLFFLQPVNQIGKETDAAFVSAGTWWIEGQNLIPLTPPNSEEHPPAVQMGAMLSEVADALRGDEPLGPDAISVSEAPLGPDLQ